VSKDVVPVQIYGVLPTESQSIAIFIGNSDKVFIINVDQTVGRAIAMSLQSQRSERPMTHELMGDIFTAFGIEVERVVINDLRSNTYYARLILKAENEVHKKIIEIDARPSDCLAIALQTKRPIFVSRAVWDEVEDNSDLLEKMKQGYPKTPTKGKKGTEEDEVS